MIRHLALLLLLSLPARALELSLEAGPASVAGEGVGPGLHVRAAVSAPAGPRQQLQLGLMSVGWREPDGSLPARTSLSLRWQRHFPSKTAAQPMVLVGLDLGLLSRLGADGYVSEGFAVSGHLGAGVRVSLTERLFAPMLVVATLGAGPPSIATVVGLGATFE